MTSSFARLVMRMGTGQPDETGLATSLPQPGTAPAISSALKTEARRTDGGRTLIVDAGGEDVIVVLAAAGGDAQQIWDFIQQRKTGRKTGRM
jgi:hypothetical protein